MKKDKELDVNLLDHDYDGIRELDNPLPNWWLITFLFTIFFSFIYYIHYEFLAGPSLDEELEVALNRIKVLQTAHGGNQMGDDDLLAFIQKESLSGSGAEIYAGKCSMCHGAELQGLIGPNLTDSFWLHGKGQLTDIYKVVKDGVPAKGMPPWDGLLTPGDIARVTQFIHSKIGSQPNNPKAPEGVEVSY